MKPRTGDFVIAACVLLLAALIWVFPLLGERGAYAAVEQNGEDVAELSLSEERELRISGCTVRVENGAVYVAESDCPDRVCVRTGKISKEGETVICVPNKISIRISGESEFDAIAG